MVVVVVLVVVVREGGKSSRIVGLISGYKSLERLPTSSKGYLRCPG